MDKRKGYKKLPGGRTYINIYIAKSDHRVGNEAGIECVKICITLHVRDKCWNGKQEYDKNDADDAWMKSSVLFYSFVKFRKDRYLNINNINVLLGSKRKNF